MVSHGLMDRRDLFYRNNQFRYIEDVEEIQWMFYSDLLVLLLNKTSSVEELKSR